MKKERRILPSKNLVFAFENLVDARARVCTRLFRFQAAVKADDWKIIRKIVSPRWREKAFPLKACRILRHFIEFAFPFAFSPLFFFLTDAWIWNPRLENIPENEDGVIIGGRNEKERERRI